MSGAAATSIGLRTSLQCGADFFGGFFQMLRTGVRFSRPEESPKPVFRSSRHNVDVQVRHALEKASPLAAVEWLSPSSA